MSTFVESLKRLYKAGRVTKEKLQTLVNSEKITAEEYYEITGEELKGEDE